MKCFMCLNDINQNEPIANIANHNVCSSCYSSVVGYMNSKRLQAQQPHNPSLKADKLLSCQNDDYINLDVLNSEQGTLRIK